MNEAIGPDIDIPGAYPSGRVPDPGDTPDPSSQQQAPTKETRDTGSLGDLTKDTSTSTVAEESGGLGSPLYDDEKRQNE
jgi:hypothetical protein